MTKTKNELGQTDLQPLPMKLKNKLPVNYYLFELAATYSNQIPALRSVSKSSFHNTNEYHTSIFYKAISNIL
jgi:hypothetical protein